MALTITVTDKATRAVTTVVGQEVSLSTPSVIQLPIPHAQIKSLAREGNDLVITTVNGETIVVHGFLADDQTGDQASQTEHNDLVFQDENGGLWLTDWSDLSAMPVDTSIDPATAAGGAGAFSPVESIDALLGDAPAAVVGGAGDAYSWLPPTYALAGFATALAAAASLGSSDTPSAKLNKPIITHNPDGTLTVSGGPGATDPGNSITVTFPDGQSQGTATANPDGSYSVTSKTPQDNGHGSVTATNPSMDSSSQGYDYSFKTPQPKIDGVTDNANGTVTVTGTADPNSKVTVLFSDGKSSKTVNADNDGKFTVDSDTIQPSGTLTVTATDQAGGHASDPLYKDYTQLAEVQITSISPDTAFPDGGSPVYGTSKDYITHAKGGSADPLKVGGTVDTGKLDSGGKVQIKIDSGDWINVSSLDSKTGIWSHDLTSGLGDGSHTLAVRIVNSSGAVVASMPQPQTLVIDTVAPSETITLTSVGGDTDGTNGYTVSSTTPTFVGKLDGALQLANNSNGVTAEALFISLDNGQNWQQVKTVNGTDWSFTPTTALTNGQTYDVTMTVADLAGNVITDPSKTVHVNVTVQTGSKDALQIKGITPDTWVDDGGNYGTGSDFTTSANGSTAHPLTVYGTLAQQLSPGDKLQVSTDGTHWYNATLDPTGSWSCPLTDTLPDGTYTLQAHVINSANKDLLTASQQLTIDATAPTQKAVMNNVQGDNVTLNPANSANWQIDDAGTHQYTLSGTLDGALAAGGGASSATPEVLQVGVQGPDGAWTWQNATVNGTTWSCPITLLLGQDTGLYTVHLRVVDLAGNSTQSPVSYELTQANGGSFIPDNPAPDPSLVPPAPDSEALTLPTAAVSGQGNTAASDPKGLFTDVTAGSTLALRLSDVLSESNGTVGLNGKHMTILGDATSTVQLDGSATLAATNWAVTGQQTIDGVTFDVYHNSTMGANTAADLLIQQGVHVI